MAAVTVPSAWWPFALIRVGKQTPTTPNTPALGDEQLAGPPASTTTSTSGRVTWHPPGLCVSGSSRACTQRSGSSLALCTPVPPVPSVCSVSEQGDPAVPCRVSRPECTLTQGGSGSAVCYISWPLASASPPGKWDCATKGK